MRAPLPLLLCAVLSLSACDKITGAGVKKEADAASTGFACRVSFKPPEDCMKENPKFRETDILKGWKDADKEINGGQLDPLMRRSNPAIPVPAPPPAVAAIPEAVPTPAPKTSKRSAKTSKSSAKTKPAAH